MNRYKYSSTQPLVKFLKLLNNFEGQVIVSCNHGNNIHYESQARERLVQFVREILEAA